MATADERRHCTRCGVWMARDNPEALCSPCQLATRDRPLAPPTVPPGFWYDGALQAAFASRHMGEVIRAYRLHPHHGRRGLSQDDIAAWAGIAQGQVSKIETGPPINRLDRLIFWAQLLGIPEEHLWFKLPEDSQATPSYPAELVAIRPGVVDHAGPLGTQTNPAIGGELIPTQQFARGDQLPLPLVALLDGTQPTPVPSRVGPSEIAQIRAAAKFYEGWDFAYGGGIVREAVMAQLRWSANLLDAGCATAQRPELFSAVGYLAHICAFMAFDDLASDDARRMWRLALACSDEADDWALRATVLSAMARGELWLGRLDDGLTLAELALVRADRLTVLEQAMLYATKARFLAAMGHRDVAVAMLGAADDCFAHADPAEVPVWMSYYDAAEHAADTGHAFADLTAVGHRTDEARTRLAGAVDGHAQNDAFARSQALNQTKLATLVMATGDPHEAGEMGLAALDVADGLRSRRLDAYLRELARQARQHHGVAEVELLHERSATLG